MVSKPFVFEFFTLKAAEEVTLSISGLVDVSISYTETLRMLLRMDVSRVVQGCSKQKGCFKDV